MADVLLPSMAVWEGRLTRGAFEPIKRRAVCALSHTMWMVVCPYGCKGGCGSGFNTQRVGRPKIWRVAARWHKRRENAGPFQLIENVQA